MPGWRRPSIGRLGRYSGTSALGNRSIGRRGGRGTPPERTVAGLLQVAPRESTRPNGDVTVGLGRGLPAGTLAGPWPSAPFRRTDLRGAGRGWSGPTRARFLRWRSSARGSPLGIVEQLSGRVGRGLARTRRDRGRPGGHGRFGSAAAGGCLGLGIGSFGSGRSGSSDGSVGSRRSDRLEVPNSRPVHLSGWAVRRERLGDGGRLLGDDVVFLCLLLPPRGGAFTRRYGLHRLFPKLWRRRRWADLRDVVVGHDRQLCFFPQHSAFLQPPGDHFEYCAEIDTDQRWMDKPTGDRRGRGGRSSVAGRTRPAWRGRPPVYGRQLPNRSE